jgi:hypothetical protein
MGLTETSLAIIPGAGGTQRLPRAIGLPRAKHLVFTAKRLNAEEAERFGLVQAVAGSGKSAFDEAMIMATAIAKNGPVALRMAKQAMNKGMQTDVSTGMAIEQLCYAGVIKTEDRLEGLKVRTACVQYPRHFFQKHLAFNCHHAAFTGFQGKARARVHGQVTRATSAAALDAVKFVSRSSLTAAALYAACLSSRHPTGYHHWAFKKISNERAHVGLAERDDAL